MAPLPGLQAIRGGGVGARRGRGNVQPARDGKAHPGILCKPGHDGTKGRGTSTGDTTTPRARRNRKSILTHRGGTFCGGGIQAATRQGGVRTAAIARGRGRHERERERQNQIISTSSTGLCTSVTVTVRGGHAQSHPIQDQRLISGTVSRRVLLSLPTPRPHPDQAKLLTRAWAPGAQDRAPSGRAAPGLLDPLVEGVGVLGELLAQLVILLLPSLLLLQLQLPLLRTKEASRG